MSLPTILLLLLAVPAQASAAPGGQAEAVVPADDKARAAEFLRFASQEAKAYTFRRETKEQGPPIVLHSEPILKWTNPIMGSVSGGLFLWTAQGRPEVVASIYQWYYPVRPRDNEFQSLSLGTFVAQRDGAPVWMPGRPGVELKPFPESPPLAGTAAQRLRQLRDLAKGFAASETDHKGLERELRLLTQPVYRYEATEGELIDGGLFVFVMGTDPEALLLIEARQAGGAPRWYYGLARMTHAKIVVNDRGREVGKVPLIEPAVVFDHREPYTKFRFEVGEPAAKPGNR